jgi:hypothetical protein
MHILAHHNPRDAFGSARAIHVNVPPTRPTLHTSSLPAVARRLSSSRGLSSVINHLFFALEEDETKDWL